MGFLGGFHFGRGPCYRVVGALGSEGGNEVYVFFPLPECPARWRSSAVFDLRSSSLPPEGSMFFYEMAVSSANRNTCLVTSFSDIPASAFEPTAAFHCRPEAGFETHELFEVD